MSRGKRYESESKLNYKKVFAVLISLAVIVITIISIINAIKNNDTTGKPSKIEYFAMYSETVGKWGVIDNLGQTVIEPIYEEMVVIPNPERAVFICTYDINDFDETYKTKIINDKNQEIYKGYSGYIAIDNYDSKQNIWYETNCIAVIKEGKYGLINIDGTEILAPEYDEISALKGVTSNIIVEKDGKKGLVNEKGQIVIPAQYTDIKTLKEGYKNEYIIVDENNKQGIITTSGKITIEPKYEKIKYIGSSEQYSAEDSGKVKLVNINGEILIDGKYDDITYVKGDNVIVAKANKYGIAGIDETVKIEPIYEELKYAFDEYFIAKKEGKYGIINLLNEQIVGFEYVSMTYIEAGNFIQADLDNSTSVILDSNLSKKIEGIISEINTNKGYVRVYTAGEYKYYNFKFEEKKVQDVLTANTLFLTKKDGKYGYVNKDGKVVIDYIYDDGTEQNSYGYAAVKKNGVWGCIDKARKRSAKTRIKFR